MAVFGKKLGLETFVDQTGNVIITKPATTGMENKKGVILQAHLDMVPQKNSNSKHNFEKDPIRAFIDGGWVKAKGTTLGADNGIGVAAAMAVLQADNIEHGPVEALFTVDEETGLTGAENLKPGILKGDILLNLDGEDEGQLYVGCAGGIFTNAVFEYSLQDIPDHFVAFKVNVSGLKGGHSGVDIHLLRANAIKVLNRLLINANEHLGLLVAEIDGGSVANAIPRGASAIVVVPDEEAGTFLGYCDEIVNMYAGIASDDAGMTVTAENITLPEKIMDVETLDNFLNAIHECRNGVIKRDNDRTDIIISSSNLGVMKSDGEKITVKTLQRGISDEEIRDVAANMKQLFEEYGAKVEQTGSFPGWAPNMNSPVLKIMKKVYCDKFGKTPDTKVVHGGLECAVLGVIYPNWDMISFGPTIRNPHSPNERVSIETVQKFWDFLLETLKHVPENIKNPRIH